MKLEVGDTAPDFNALDQNLERHILSKAVKKGKVLLAFYAADDTPVCTAQLCDYRDHLEGFQALGVQLFGISISDQAEHLKFAQKIHVNYPLLNDYDARITHKYGVMSWLGVPRRAIFLIDETQKILYKRVELLPITRAMSGELFEEMQKLLGLSLPPMKAKETAASHTDHHH